MNKWFNKVYPFATEDISGYFKEFDFKNKKVLTLGSSLDQAYNALLLGASSIKVYDINDNILEFGKLKRNKILTFSRREVYREVLSINEVPMSTDVFESDLVEKINPYLENDSSYDALRNILRENPDIISYQVGDITNLSLEEDESFDIIILSNAISYLYLFSKGKDVYKELKRIFDSLNLHLNKDGIIQLLYIYSVTKKNFTRDTANPTDSILNVEDALSPNLGKIHMFKSNIEGEDAVVYYKK